MQHACSKNRTPAGASQSMGSIGNAVPPTGPSGPPSAGPALGGSVIPGADDPWSEAARLLISSATQHGSGSAPMRPEAPPWPAFAAASGGAGGSQVFLAVSLRAWAPSSHPAGSWRQGSAHAPALKAIKEVVRQNLQQAVSHRLNGLSR